MLFEIDIVQALLFDLKPSLSSAPSELRWSDFAIALHRKSFALHVHGSYRGWQMLQLLSYKLHVFSHHFKSLSNHRIKWFSFPILCLVHRNDNSNHS